MKLNRIIYWTVAIGVNLIVLTIIFFSFKNQSETNLENNEDYIPYELMNNYFPDTCINSPYPSGRKVFEIDTTASEITVMLWVRNCKCYKLTEKNIINNDSFDIHLENELSLFKKKALNYFKYESNCNLKEDELMIGYEYLPMYEHFLNYYGID